MIQASIQLSEEIMNAANQYAAVSSRSVPMQIEHWARIGKIAEDNPDLPYEFIENVLKAKAEIDGGEASAFEFRHE